MAKQSGLDRAIAKVEAEIAQLQLVLERLKAEKGAAVPKRTRKPKLVDTQKVG